ncbi:MAG: tetratricopeptide repeat protein [Mariprofundus sp.]|nr:tetratricopeptide repeat protein [Mariprofundus sp.]
MEPRFLYLAAQDAIKDGQYQLASELLSALVEKDENAIMPHLQLIELLLQSRKYDLVKQHIATLLQQKTLPTEKRIHLELAQVRLLAGQNQTDAALKQLESFLTIHPKHLDARELQIKLLTNANRFDEALAALETSIQIDELPEFRLLQAQLFIKKNDFNAAKSSLIRAHTLAPHHDTPVLLLSSIALQSNHINEAESLLRSFLIAHPEAFRISQALGQLLVRDKRQVEAIMVYRQAVQHSGNNPDIMRSLGLLYFRLQNYSESEKTFRKLIENKSDDLSLFYLGASLEALDRNKEAQTIYQNIDAGSTLAADAQIRLAAIAVMNNDIKQGEKRLKSILKKHTMHLDALLMLSTIRLSQHKYQQLIDETDITMGIPKTPAQLLFNRAVAFESLKQYDQVESTINQLLKTTPTHAEAMNFLAYTYAIQGIKLGKAEALLHRALLLKPDNGYYLDSLAWVYYMSGKFPKAIETQVQALKKISDDAVMFEHYGDMLWQHGDMQGARNAWQQAITFKSPNIQVIKHKISKGIPPLQ